MDSSQEPSTTATPAGTMAALTTLPEAQRDLLAALRQRDLVMLAAIDLIPDAADGDGPPLDALLAVDASLRRVDRRTLCTVARILPHLPTLRAAVEHGRLSFDLAARICVTASTNRLTIGQLALLDDHLTMLLADDAQPDRVRWDADELHDRVLDACVAIRPDAAEATEARVTDAVTYSPDLFGGGHIGLDATPETYQAVTGAIDHVMARDGLLDRSQLVRNDDDLGHLRDEVSWVHNHDTIASARAAALTAIAHDTLTGRGAGVAGGRRRAVPSLQLVVGFDTLVGDDDLPALLLGGQRLTAATARRIVDRDGADVTTMVVDRDCGEVLGVGRRHRRPPDWLRELTAVLQPFCVMPGCRSRVTDDDHNTAWTDGGPTDLANLARLCRKHHTDKDRHKVWQLAGDATGTTTVTHVRSGWTATSRPRPTGPAPPDRATADAQRRTRQPRLPLPTARSRPPPDDAPVDPDLPY